MSQRVKDVMTRAVVAVGDDAPFKRIVEMLHEYGISALPVVDAANRVVGVVTEDDLLVKEGLVEEVEAHRGFPVGGQRRERTKADGLVAGEVMTAPAVTIRPDASLSEAARLLHGRHLKRLPVVDEHGALVGIVSRADLLRVFLRPDADILREVREHVLPRSLSLEPGTVRTEVRDGIVMLEGQVERRSQIPMVVAAVRAVEGVVGVDARLSFARDDILTGMPAARLGTLGRSPWQVVTGGRGV